MITAVNVGARSRSLPAVPPGASGNSRHTPCRPRRGDRWRPSISTILLLGCLFAGGCGERIELGAGAHAPDAPQQWPIDAPARSLGDFRITPVAGYAITAKVLGKRRYRWDALSPIAPWDFALGWGAMSDETWLKPTSVSQGDRFMFWHLYDSPLNIANVNRLSANVHLIPENDTVLEVLQSTPIGAIVSLSGQLVNIHFPDNRVIPSSLTRLDTGAGACEILLVVQAEVIQPASVISSPQQGPISL